MLNPCWPTYEASIVIDQGSASCTPPFHCTDEGSLASYSNTFSDGGVVVDRPPLPSDCSWPYRTVICCSVGGFRIVSKTELPLGRSKNNPPPPRSTSFCRPL